MNKRRVVDTKIAWCKTDIKSIKVFGAMLLDGNDVAMTSENSRKEDFIEFLNALRRENPLRTILLILDNARIHHAKATGEESERLDIKLVHLPPYSPDLNPIEFAWKDGKKQLAMQDYEAIREKAKNTILEIMQQRKTGYTKAWTEKFPIELRGR